MFTAWQYHETFQPYDSLDVIMPVPVSNQFLTDDLFRADTSYKSYSYRIFFVLELDKVPGVDMLKVEAPRRYEIESDKIRSQPPP